jgi:hypothetical protein
MSDDCPLCQSDKSLIKTRRNRALLPVLNKQPNPPDWSYMLYIPVGDPRLKQIPAGKHEWVCPINCGKVARHQGCEINCTNPLCLLEHFCVYDPSHGYEDEL